jgi:iron complex transport system substrate-binding protein
VILIKTILWRDSLLNKITLLIWLFLYIFTFISCSSDKNKGSSSEIRCISLSPHITEIIYALEAQDQLIAVTDFCQYPNEAVKKEKIGGLLDPNIEKIIALKPTHLFGVPAHEKLNQEIQKFGLNIIMMPNENIEDVLKSIKIIGQEIELHEKSNQLIQKINIKFDSIRVKSSERKKVKAVLIIGREKGNLRNIMVAGNNTFLDQIWQLVGGQNIYADLASHYGTINLESLLLRNPEVIIEFNLDQSRSVSRSQVTSEWNILEEIKAVKNGNIFVVNGNHTLIPGPRMVLLAEDFAEVINEADHP